MSLSETAFYSMKEVENKECKVILLLKKKYPEFGS
jgi:hypothetical protein